MLEGLRQMTERRRKLLRIVYAFSGAGACGDARGSGDAPVVLGGRAGWHGQRLLAGRTVGVDEVRELLAAQRLLPHERHGNGVERGPVVGQHAARTVVRLFDQAAYRRVDAPRRRITV